jgi:hypothetical protein
MPGSHGRERITMAERPRLKHRQRSQPTRLHAGGVDPFHCPIQGDGRTRFRRRRSLYSARCRRLAGFDFKRSVGRVQAE